MELDFWQPFLDQGRFCEAERKSKGRRGDNLTAASFLQLNSVYEIELDWMYAPELRGHRHNRSRLRRCKTTEAHDHLR